MSKVTVILKGMKSLLHAFDALVTSWIRRLPRSSTPFFLTITNMGDPIVVTLLAGLLALGAFLAGSLQLTLATLVVPATLVVGYGIKLLFERARPISEFSYTLRLDTFSFPSGHSSGSTALYGLAACTMWQLLGWPYSWLALIVGFLPVVIGVSRLYLGVHYPSDVLAGWLLGIVMLVATFALFQPFP